MFELAVLISYFARVHAKQPVQVFIIPSDFFGFLVTKEIVQKWFDDNPTMDVRFRFVVTAVIAPETPIERSGTLTGSWRVRMVHERLLDMEEDAIKQNAVQVIDLGTVSHELFGQCSDDRMYEPIQRIPQPPLWSTHPLKDSIAKFTDDMYICGSA
jgi:hypothetical protein